MHVQNHSLTEKESGGRRQAESLQLGATAMKPAAAMCARTGATGPAPRALSLQPPCSAQEAACWNCSRGRAWVFSATDTEGRAKGKGAKGEAWSGRGLGQDPQPHLGTPRVRTCTRLLRSSLPFPTHGDHLCLPTASLPPSPPGFLCSPSLPRACSPPPRLAALGSSSLSSPGDGQRARGALQLWSSRSPRPRCPAPPPPLSPPGCPPTPALLLGQRRHRRKPSSRPRCATLTRPGWRFPLSGWNRWVPKSPGC